MIDRTSAGHALRAQHLEAWGEDYNPPGSLILPEERWLLCEQARNSPPGCIVEVGVYWGGSAYNLIDTAKLQDRQIWLYDTFEGMMDSDPDKGDAIPLGDIKADEAKVRESLGLYPHIVKCAFPYTDQLPPAPVAFAHIDCDQYHSILETCRALDPLMAKGGAIWFNDTPTLEGARRAVRDFYMPGADMLTFDDACRIKYDHDSGQWFVRY